MCVFVSFKFKDIFFHARVFREDIMLQTHTHTHVHNKNICIALLNRLNEIKKNRS